MSAGDGPSPPDAPDADPEPPRLLDSNGKARPSTPDRTGSEADPDADDEPVVPAEILEKLPPRQRRQVESFIAASLSYTGPIPNPLTRKVTPEHITEIIRNQGRDSELEYADRKHGRMFAAIGGLGGGVIAVALIIVLALNGNDALANDIVQAGLFAAGGLGAGYGICKWQSRGD